MKHKNFYDESHARMYLEGSIIMVDNEPVVVQRIVDKDTLCYIKLCQKYKEQNIKLDDNKVDLTPIGLGFVNHNTYDLPYDTTRAFRMPTRQWRIGLTQSTLFLSPEMSNSSRKKLLYSKHMRNTILNIYPSYNEAIKKIKEHSVKSIAFDRVFSIDEGGYLYHLHSTLPIGKIYKDEFKLNDKHIYLGEVLERAMRC